MTPAVTLKGISKRFGSVQALDDVSITVEAGTMHAIVGENGAGKTTLMKVLYGAYAPDTGELMIDEKGTKLRSSREAITLGVGMVSQHYGIIGELSCLQNLILGAEPGATLDLNSLRKKAEELATKMGFEFDWDASAETLSPSSAQKLEILKLLWRNAKIMILDEPTAMLSPADADALFASLRLLVQQGTTVLLVTHRLPEVMDYCSRVTVLRGGRKVAERIVAETNSTELAELIIGGTMEAPPQLEDLPESEPIIQAKHLTVLGTRGDRAVKSVTFRIGRGEVVGLAGVDGNGQRELIRALVGVSRVESGQIVFQGKEISNTSVRERLDAGIQLIAEDRLGEALVEDWPLTVNSILGLHHREEFQTGRGFDAATVEEWTNKVVSLFGTKHGGIKQPIRGLSGGNQQRFVAGRALLAEPKLLLAFQPARGLDIVGTEKIYQAVREHCQRGMGALIVSFDLDELLTHCDRVIAMNGGELFEPSHDERRSRDAIGRLMVGAR